MFGKSREDLLHITAKLGEPSFRSTQLFEWMYKKQVYNLPDMTNLSLALREKLNQDYCIQPLSPGRSNASQDGTKKYLFPAGQGRFVEAAYIPIPTGLPCVCLLR